MFKQIVAGIDERYDGADAIALARTLLAPDGELTLAHVAVGTAHAYRDADPRAVASDREHARELLEQAAERAHLHPRLRWRSSESVGRGLHELCEAVGADLLVVGSSRHGLLGRVLLGDDTRDSLDGAPCAVAIAPAGYANETVAMREIGVGYDGSPESEHALQIARSLAAQTGAKVSAFQVVSLAASTLGPGALPLSDAVDPLVEQARERIAALGEVEPHAAYGRPSEELAIYSASLDLLIVGSRGYGPLGRLLHGSTSRALARLARCPLLVLTRAARASELGEHAGEFAPPAGV
ncbi:MAG: universal stress protein [Solirubrobacteraceae bacterium]